MLFFLFGPPGVGKNYSAEVLQNNFNFYFYDADEDLTPTLLKAIEEQGPFTEADRQAYFSIVFDRIDALKKTHPRLVIAQAMIFNKDRHDCLHRFPEIQMISVEASAAVADERIKKRKDMVKVQYAQAVRKRFEIPTHNFVPLDNNHDATHLIKQFEKIIHEFSTNNYLGN